VHCALPVNSTIGLSVSDVDVYPISITSFVFPVWLAVVAADDGPWLNPLKMFPLEVGQEGRILHGAVSIRMLADLTVPLTLGCFANSCMVHLNPSVTDSMFPVETVDTLNALLMRPDRFLASNTVDDLCSLPWSEINLWL